MRRFSLLLVAVVVAVTVAPLLGDPTDPTAHAGHGAHGVHVHTALAQTVPCWPAGTPLGALPPAVPTWCSPTASGPATFTQGANAWLDDFEHGLSNASIGPGYRVFDSQELIYKTQHFRHANHWMMDLAPRDPAGDGLLGGGMLRPDRSFRFEGGKLTIETDVAAGIADYGNDAWPEITVTTAPAPTGKIPDSLYAYGQFGGHWSFGCRLQASRGPICALYNPDGAAGNPAYFGTPAGRVFEMSHFQHIGAQVYGGEPGPVGGERDRAWRVCRGTDPDLNCRDRFRLELTKTSVTLFVNGTRYFQQSGLPVGAQLPDALVNGDVYTYFAGWQVRQTAPTIRFHWDRVAVNPGAASTPPPPTATPTATPATTATATRTPIATATRTPVATATGTPAVTGDTTPPTLSNVRVKSNTSGVATITWRTNEAADTQVEYGATTAYGSTTQLDPRRVTNHSQLLTGLRTNTLYHYRVKSRDAAGNLTTSDDFTFTIKARQR